MSRYQTALHCLLFLGVHLLCFTTFIAAWLAAYLWLALCAVASVALPGDYVKRGLLSVGMTRLFRTPKELICDYYPAKEEGESKEQATQKPEQPAKREPRKTRMG